MKKYITIISLLLISIFISTTSVNASTRLVFDETSNGNINTSLGFETGFVGGIDITLKINGNVEYKSFNLDSSITNKKYTTNVSYNEKNKTVNIVIVTGGVGTSHNLLNNKKELKLGSLVVNANANKDISYTVDCSSLIVLDNSWKSSKISPEMTNNKLTFKADQKPNDDKDNETQGNNDNNQDSNVNNGEVNNNQGQNTQENNSNTNNNTNTNTQNNNGNTNSTGSNNSNSQNVPASGKDNATSDKSDSKDNDKDDEDADLDKDDAKENSNKTTNDNKTSNNDDDNDYSDAEDEEDDNGFKLWLVIPIGVVGLGAITGFAISKKKKKTPNDFDI